MMLKTDSPQKIIDQLLNEVFNMVASSRAAIADPGRTKVEKNYFTGCFDGAAMVARRFAASGLVDRKAFLEKCGLTP